MLTLLLYISIVNAKIWNIKEEPIGIKPGDSSKRTYNANTEAWNNALNNSNIVKSGDTLLIPGPSSQIFWFNGGMVAYNIRDITIQIDGTIKFQSDRNEWPKGGKYQCCHMKQVSEAMYWREIHNITFTSSNKKEYGTIDGNGYDWYGALNYCIYAEDRPRLFHVYNSSNILVEYIHMKNAPYWHTYFEDIDTLEISNSKVTVDIIKSQKDTHDFFEITAFNTDGFDVAGTNIYVHDIYVWNDDDCIAVKRQTGRDYQSQCSENMLFENINASGLGLSIGSIPPDKTHSCVNNITIRNAVMHNTVKGIYVKSAPGRAGATGQMTNILFENITMYAPIQVPIWIGPQQAGYGGQCSLLWPLIYSDPSHCPVSPAIDVSNITLRDINIYRPKQSPGNIWGNLVNPMKNIIFENVVVTDSGGEPWGNNYNCDGAMNVISIGATDPKPDCTQTSPAPSRSPTTIHPTNPPTRSPTNAGKSLMKGLTVQSICKVLQTILVPLDKFILFSAKELDKLAHEFDGELAEIHDKMEKDTWQIFDCPSRRCCRQKDGCRVLDDLINIFNNSGKVKRLCAENRDPNTPLCGACLPGYSELYGSEKCAKCENNHLYYILIPLFMTILFAIFLYYIKIEHFKVLIYYWQGLFLVFDLIGVTTLSAYYLLPLLNFSNISMDYFAGYSGICFIKEMTSPTEIWINVLPPVLIFIMIFGKFPLLHKCNIIKINHRWMKNAFWKADLITISSFMTALYRILACRNIGGGKTVHFYYGSHECYDAPWWIALILICAVHIHLITVWFILFCKTQKQRESKHNRYIVFVRSYKDKYWYWEWVLFARRGLICLFINVAHNLQILWNILLLIILLIFLGVHTKCKPFKEYQVYHCVGIGINMLETICQCYLIFAFMLVTIYNYSGFADAILSTLLIMAVLIPVILYLIRPKFIKKIVDVEAAITGIELAIDNKVDKGVDDGDMETNDKGVDDDDDKETNDKVVDDDGDMETNET